jgi:hypothetical protein
LPRLVVTCAREACQRSDLLNLRAVTKRFAGKIEVSAIEPYENPKFAEQFDKLVTPLLENAVTIAATAGFLKQHGSEPTPDAVSQAINNLGANPELRAYIKKRKEGEMLLAEANPKAYFFAAKGKLVSVLPGVGSEAELLKFIEDSTKAKSIVKQTKEQSK